MGLEKGEERGKEAKCRWGDEIFATHLSLHLQQAEEVQVLLHFCDLAPELGRSKQAG